MNTFECIQHLNANHEWKKESFSPAEQVAIIALRPCLPFIGGRIMEMIDLAIKGKETP